jgi:hydrogenase maturation protein HypF
MSDLRGAHISITGIVQGVGFRPFVYGLAKRHGLTGWVRNSSAGVDIQVDGFPEALESFVKDLQGQAPPLARIHQIQVERRPADGFAAFEIVHSESIPEAFLPISPDIAVCSDCLRELFDPQDRRYRYPFTNCTNCGPRFTIIRTIPYDRPNTTMARFAMCPECAAEYADPLNRRFHAQPIACPACGPQIWLEAGGRKLAEREGALAAARELLAQGRILAVRGLGGFHLACDGTNPEVVTELRQRKLRVDKPFAVMVFDRAVAEAQCVVSPDAADLLEAPERPIVILPRRKSGAIAREVAPGQSTVGLMLPYTPLHFLLLEPTPEFPQALVMTSGNVSDEPIAAENDEARQRLAALADAFLMHDREIESRCDDSVVRQFATATSNHAVEELVAGEDRMATVPIRRSRGYAPFPVLLPGEGVSVLAVGAELKNVFCLRRGRYAFLSQHIGDMENYETLVAFEKAVGHFESLFNARPEALAYDLHPDYLATRYALARAERDGVTGLGVQHHHAHIASCMAENGLEGEERVIGVAFDGVGYGSDDTLWGGEFLLADYGAFERSYHLETIPLPGGDAAVRQPWRLALAWLDRAGLEWGGDLPPVRQSTEAERRVLQRMIHSQGSRAGDGLNAPLTSSMGRLFDAVSALVGVREEVNFEGQAAILLEAAVDPEEAEAYPFEIVEGVIGPKGLIRGVVDDYRSHVSVPRIAARFHNAVASMVREVCRQMRGRSGVKRVALSGGVWQNMTLLQKCVSTLREDGFDVLFHTQVPPNDGGLALGQAVIASHRLVNGGGLGGSGRS